MGCSSFSLPARIWIALLRGLVLASALACGLSWAIDPATMGVTGDAWNASGVNPPYYDSAGSACASVPSTYVLTGVVMMPAAGGANCLADIGAYSSVFIVRGHCATGYVLQSDGSCQKPKPNCPAVGQSVPGGNTASGTSSTQTVLNPLVCIGSCAYSYDTYWTGAAPGQAGYSVQWQGLHSTGGACTGSEANASSGSVNANSNVNCPDHTYQGTVNGQNVCVPYPVQTTGGSTSTTTTDAPASSPAATSTSDSSTSTTCDGTTCTTTTTTTTTGGSGSGSGASGVGASTCASSSGASAVAGTCTTTTTQPQTQYCQQNPTAAQCQQDSASGGADCSAAPTCSGDAVNCAILAQQWLARCDLQKSKDPSITLGQQIQAGNDPMASKLPTPDGAAQVDMSQKFSSVDDMGISAQCLPNIDVAVPLPGGAWAMHMDTSPLCSMGQLLGYLNMLSTLMLCAYMLKGSF